MEQLELNRAFVYQNRKTFGLTADFFDLQEKVIQFGTGVLLRGLVDYAIDKANKKQIFNGSVVIVKSTAGTVDDFIHQDNLYTILEQGRNKKQIINEKSLVTCISRVLTASTDWERILGCAADPVIEIAISNTTEAGLVFVSEPIGNGVPKSFPAKLAAYLWHRYQTFKGDTSKGMVVLPTELRSGNGSMLKEFVLRHAINNKLPRAFIAWVLNSNHFCNTLVDRMVPGRSEKDDVIEWDSQVSYVDRLHLKAEPYLLWAIEGNNTVKEKLTFTKGDDRIIITENISGYEEQKLRILNGSNSLVAPLAFLAGCDTLLDTVTDNLFFTYTERLIDKEIVPTILKQVPNAAAFAKEVLNRFANPFVQYKLLNVTLQCSSKINSRNSATIIRHYRAFNHFPPLTLIGLASFFLFYTPDGKKDGTYYGTRDGEPYFFRDMHTEFLCTVLVDIEWNSDPAKDKVKRIFENEKIFSRELASLPGISEAVVHYCVMLKRAGIRSTMMYYLNNK